MFKKNIQKCKKIAILWLFFSSFVEGRWQKCPRSCQKWLENMYSIFFQCKTSWMFFFKFSKEVFVANALFFENLACKFCQKNLIWDEKFSPTVDPLAPLPPFGTHLPCSHPWPAGSPSLGGTPVNFFFQSLLSFYAIFLFHFGKILASSIQPNWKKKPKQSKGGHLG